MTGGRRGAARTAMTSSHQELFDRQAIVDVCINYALALDSRDWARLRSCFTETAVADYGGLGSSNSYEAIEQTCRAAVEPLTASQHLLGNHLVAVAGDSATGTSYFQAQHVREGLVESITSSPAATRTTSSGLRKGGGSPTARLP